MSLKCRQQHNNTKHHENTNKMKKENQNQSHNKSNVIEHFYEIVEKILSTLIAYKD